ncbi:MAG TPA: aminotransferase class I/II-fold pyridoxal phosphate-dependent enzyme [Mycobacteriales bacterium]
MVTAGFEEGGFSPASLRRRGSVKWRRYPEDVLALWVAEMDFPAPPPVQAAVVDAVARQEYGYPVSDRESDLPAAVAAWEEERYGWRVDPARVHVLPDVLKGVELAVERYSPTDSAVILITPAYMPFFDVPRVTRRPSIEVPTLVEDGVRRLDIAGIDAAFARGGGTVVLCHPYNPVGRSFSADELTSLCEVVDRHGGRVVSDEVHAPLTYAGDRHVPYASISPVAAGHTLTLVSASKAWNLPGLKCAQAIVSSDVDEERWRSLPPLKTHGASTLGIRANVAAFREGGAWLDDAVAFLDGNRRLLADLLAEHLPGVRYTVPEATYLAWLDCRALDLPVEASEFFLTRARVATNPGPAFGTDGAGHVRLNFATSREILERAVAAMGAVVSRR